MNRKRWPAVLGVVGATAVLSGCLEKEVKELQKEVKELKASRDSLYDYLEPGGPINVWLDSLGISVCELELHVPGLDPMKRHCTGPGPGDKTPPPAYPPP